MFVAGSGVELSVGCRLNYSIATATNFIFQINAAKADSQIVTSENLRLPPNKQNTGFSTYDDPISGNRKVRALLGPGSIAVEYEATVAITPDPTDLSNVAEFGFDEIPFEFLDYLAPSRYCPSDTFTEFSHQQFSHLPQGASRVRSIADWIFENIQYQAGASGPSTNAAEVFRSRRGVCRDFAHLGISLSRAVGLPARYASVYADGLVPQDFHAIFQVYLRGPLGGAWYSFDASRMSAVDRVVRIAAGRDAADVAFAWPQGEVSFDPPQVWVGIRP